LPGRGASNWSFRLDGNSPDEDSRYTGVVSVTPEFFDVFGGTARRGRLLQSTDTRGSQRVAVVNESFVARCSTDRDPVGRTVQLSGPEFLVVGVVSDLAMQDPENAAGDGLYVPLEQFNAGQVWVVARTTGAPLAIAESVMDAVAAVDPDLPVMIIATLYDAIWSDKRVLDAVGTLFIVFGVGALLPTVIGLHGVVAFAVNHASGRSASGRARRRSRRCVRPGPRPGLAPARPRARVRTVTAARGRPRVRRTRGPAHLLSVVGCLVLTSVAALVAPARRAMALQPATVLRD
jgi:hypothetical protein